MTKIAYIHGLGASMQPPADEWQGRGESIPRQPFIDYMSMTSGQMKLSLLKEQLRILGAYYPEARPEITPAITKIDNALYQGLHGLGLMDSGYSNVMREVNKAIRQSKYMLRAAGGYIAPRSARVGIEPGEGFEEIVTTSNNGGAILEIPNQDLQTYAQLPNCQKLVDELRKISPLAFKLKAAKKAQLEECYHREKLVKLMNEKLEKSGHHMIYNFATAQLAAPYPAVVTKRILHSQAVAGFSSISNIDRANLALWLQNGIMRSNALNGAPPLMPLATIDTFRNYYIKNQPGVGEPVTATITLITAIVSAITAAAGAVIAIVQQLRQAELARLGDQITDPTFSMEDTDFLNGNTNTDTGANNWLLPLAAGGVALFLLSK